MEEYIQQLHPFLTLALYGNKWSVSGPGHPIPGATTHGYAGPKIWYGHLKEEKINLLPLPGIKPWIVAQSLYYWGTKSLHITPDWSQSLTLHAKDVSRLAGSFVLFIQSIGCVFLPETTSMINFLVCMQSNCWPSHVLLSCFWNNLTPNAWICMKIHGGDAPKICQYNPVLVKMGQSKRQFIQRTAYTGDYFGSQHSSVATVMECASSGLLCAGLLSCKVWNQQGIPLQCIITSPFWEL